jgi:hypothetical protein
MMVHYIVKETATRPESEPDKYRQHTQIYVFKTNFDIIIPHCLFIFLKIKECVYISILNFYTINIKLSPMYFI